MLIVEELKGVTAVREKVTEELEAASLADEEGPTLGKRRARAQSLLARGRAQMPAHALRAPRPHRPPQLAERGPGRCV